MRDDRRAAELLQRLEAMSLSRRGLFRGAGATGAVLLGGNLLAACGSDGSANRDTATTEDKSSSEKTIAWSNWPLYLDVDEETNKRATLDAFQEKTGITVTYTEDVNDNEEFFAKIRPQLQSGKATGRDIVVLTDWMAGRMIRLKYVQELDKSKIPNADNLVEALRSPGFDSDRSYTLPWQSGLTGIAYNPKATGGKEIRTITELLTEPALKGKVTALTEMRDTVGLLLLEMGKDPADFTDTDFENAIDMLQKAVKDGQIRQFTGNEYAASLASGNVAACIAWSGDVIQLQADQPDIAYVVPEAGAMIWSDNMMIPAFSEHQSNAHALMDHYYDPEVAAQVAAYVNYICPVEGAKEAMEQVDPELVEEQLIFPDDETLAKTNVFRALDDDEEKTYTDLFTEVTGA